MNKQGFTLVEMLIVIVLAASISAAVGFALTAGARNFRQILSKQTSNSQALLALRMIEKRLNAVSCTQDTTCGASVASVLNSGYAGSGEFLQGLIQDASNTTTYFRFEYTGDGINPGTIRYCEQAATFPSGCSGGLAVALNIYNNPAVPAERMFTVNGSQITVLLKSLDGREGNSLRFRTFQSNFVVAYGS